MGTSYEVVFRSALAKIRDFNLIELEDYVAEEELLEMMNTAILDFEYPRVNLKQKNDSTSEFDNVLDFDTIQLLGYLMAKAWLDLNIMNTDSLRTSMTPEEYKSSSKGLMLSSLDKINARYSDKVRQLKLAYSNRDENNKSKLGVLSGGGRQ
jgi:hypothetical protein